MTTQGVVNLSNRPLTQHEITLLQRGLKFCPTPACPDPGEGRADLDALHRRLRLMSFYEERPPTLNETSVSQDVGPSNNNQLLSNKAFKHSKFKLKSTWRGPVGPPNLEAFIASNLVDYNRRPVYRDPDKKNLSRSENLALRALKADKTIVIKPADKGSSIVIMNRADYLREGYKQLSDANFYTHMEEDLTKKHMDEIKGLVEDLYQNTEIDETVKDYLTRDTGKTARFYLLPKIHKNILPPPGRPVVAGIGSPTEKISQFVDHFLNPVSMKVRSYLKDTNEFLRILNRTPILKPGTLLVTMDVCSLYTNIPNDDGLRASLLALNLHRRGAVKPTNLSIIKLLNLVLKRNNFHFNGNNYLQIGGTAIGTKAAPSFAITYMGAYEEEHVYTYGLQPLLYLRYIDDIFMLWPHGEKELSTFIEHLNNRVPTIKFTEEHSATNVSFLDVMVRIINNKLETDLFSKPTDSHDYLLYSSAHPQRCKDSIPYSQFLRIRRICSRMEDYEYNVIQLSSHFIRRQYPEELILDAAILARRLDRDTLLNTEREPIEQDKEKVFLITTFHPSDHQVREVVHKNWDILGQSPTTDKLFQKKLVVGYRRPKNLRDLLVTAAIPRLEIDSLVDPHYIPPVVQVTNPTVTDALVTLPVVKERQSCITEFFQTPPAGAALVSSGAEAHHNLNTPVSRPRLGTNPLKRGFKFCKSTKLCRYCPLLNKTGLIKSHTTGKEYQCMKFVSCRSSNLVYCITCTRCGIQYVGQTSIRVMDRFVKHFGDIQTPDLTKTVARHFSLRCHNSIGDVEITVLEYISKAPASQAAKTIRDRVERRWMHLLRTCAPQGLNIDD